jgi:hypothetical protein
MTLQERIAKQIRQVYPWLVADWNGKEYESMTEQTNRKLNAVTEHLHSLEERYAELENRLNEHANGVTRHRAPMIKEPEADKELKTMISQEIVQAVDYILDDKVSQIYKDQPLAQDWARVTKIGEELGEAIQELILFTGQNPRKSIDSKAYDRLLAELADTAMTGIYAIQHFTKDIRKTTQIMDAAQYKHAERLGYYS